MLDLNLPVMDVRSVEYNDDPHTYLRELRSRSPIARNIYGMPVLLDYDDVNSTLSSPHVENDYKQLFAKLGVTDGPFADWHLGTILHRDGPEHTRLRKLVMHAFTPRAVGRMRSQISDITSALLDDIDYREPVEFIHEVAHKLPVQVICEVLGIPRDDHATFDVWVTDLNQMFSEEAAADGRAIAERAIVNLFQYLSDLIETRKLDLGTDMLSTLLVAEEDGERLSRGELLSMVVLLMHGGHDTTRGLLMTMMHLLAADQPLQRRLREDRSLLTGAIEETLRFEPTLPLLLRKTTSPMTFHGVTVPAGEMIQLSLLAANRDPMTFPAPDTFDPTRKGQPHLAFGHGAHYCPGNALARIEMYEAMDVILSRWSGWHFADAEPPKWLPYVSIRGFGSLRLDVERS